MARPNWNTRIYKNLIWAKFRIILRNERDAIERIDDLIDDIEEALVYSVAVEDAFRRYRPSDLRVYSRQWVERNVRARLRNFAREAKEAVAKEAKDASDQTRMATRAAILGKPIRNTLQEAAESGGRPVHQYDIEGLIPWEDLPEESYAEVYTDSFLGTSLSAWEKSLANNALPVMAKQFSTAMAAGEGIDKIMKRLRYSLDIPRRSAMKMARTAVQAAANRMQDKVYRANADLMQAKVVTATLDFRTCEVCGGYDGREYPVKGASPYIPVHIQCRCTYVPIMKSAAELGLGPLEIPDKGTRESMNGHVPETMTYDDWMKQDDVKREYDAWLRTQRQKQYKRAKRKRKALEKAEAKK